MNVEKNKIKIDFALFFKRNKITNTINWISWLYIAFGSIFFSIVLFILNKTTIIGKENIPKNTKNVILASNHTSYAFDSIFIGIVAFLPQTLFYGFTLPYHPTAYEHYYSNKIITFIGKQLRCFPVKRKWKHEGGLSKEIGSFDEEGVNLSLEALKYGPVIYFPEGTRSKDGQIGEGKPGAGMLPYDSKATVIPVRIENVDKLLTKKSKFFKMGLKLKVTYGKPIFLDDLYNMEKSKETSKLIVDRIMDEIKKL
ncbi:MAG: 1-acyl-sn-glycerol-3-phosphate acyltransferase [Candidatus Sericytochromatia bacterium]|nr:1-acyl-sn-glycerol-3-phosphate acyltransferase [Candidatus Sericytochromatia bacterium]